MHLSMVRSQPFTPNLYETLDSGIYLAIDGISLGLIILIFGIKTAIYGVRIKRDKSERIKNGLFLTLHLFTAICALCSMVYAYGLQDSSVSLYNKDGHFDSY